MNTADRASEHAAPIRVIYVMGSGRSGSTLLSSMLGTQADIVSVGEVYNYKNFFESADSQARTCSCGAMLNDCELWCEVRKRVRLETGEEFIDLKDTRPDVFGRNNHILFDSIRGASGKNVIVDASKRHYRLNLLLGMDALQVIIVHLVRDARAYAYSSLVTARQRGQSDMAYYGKLAEWQKKNLGISMLYGSKPGYIRVRYEDLVHDRERELARMLEHCDLALDRERLYGEDNNGHEFSGNKRFISKGLTEIRLDTRYLDKLSDVQWLAGSVLAAPALLAFGYPLFGRSAPA